MAGFLDRFGPFSRNFSISRSLQDLSSLGMKYDDMIIRYDAFSRLYTIEGDLEPCFDRVRRSKHPFQTRRPLRIVIFPMTRRRTLGKKWVQT